MIRIIADSACDLCLEAAKDLNVEIIPLNVKIGETTYRDRYDLEPEQFYEMLSNAKELPKTSMINPFEWETIFKKVNDAGDEAVVITMSSALSGTYQAANIAADDYDCIHVVDSRSITVTEQALVRYACMLRDNGRNASNIADMLRSEADELKIVAIVDTMDYLKAGGRVSGAVAAVGSLLNIKPLIGQADGKLSLLGKARGYKNAMVQMKKLSNNFGIDYTKPVVFAYSGDIASTLDDYIEGCKEEFSGYEKNIHKTIAGATIGTHTGPGCITIGFFPVH